MKNTLIFALLIFSGFGLWAQETRILQIGDSHSVGRYGMKLRHYLQTIPQAKVHTAASCGSIAKWWYAGAKGKTTSSPCGVVNLSPGATWALSASKSTPSIENLLISFQPTHVVVQLGGNYFSSEDEYIKKDVLRLIESIKNKNAKCLWVSNPDSRSPEVRKQKQRLVDVLKATVMDHCEFLDSTAITKYPEKCTYNGVKPMKCDGVHYWGHEAEIETTRWAQKTYLNFIHLLSQK